MKWVVANGDFTLVSLMRMWTEMGTVVCGDGWRRRWLLRGWSGDEDDVEAIAGIEVGMGMRVAGTFRDGYKYLSPCSCLVETRVRRHSENLRGLLRSSAIRRTRLSTVDEHEFPVVGSRLWNSLPCDITSTPLLDVFRKRRKTHPFCCFSC